MRHPEAQSLHDLYAVYSALEKLDVEPGQQREPVMNEESFSCWVLDTCRQLWFSMASMYTEHHVAFQRSPRGVVVHPLLQWEMILA